MAITASEARRSLFGLLEQVNDDAESVEIINRRGAKAHLVPDQEYRSLRELAHLVASPANAAQLFQGIMEAREGLGVPHDLINTPDEVAS
ncbi:MAG: antitoxin YefM [Actinomycetota bacterium]|nr:antitoxin YefM [Actinomycetota bacterium]